MIVNPLIVLAVMVLTQISKGSDFVVKEQELLNKNLQIIRRDFNKLIENVEDFAEDFLKQIQEAGTLIENSYVKDDDYNWQEDNSNALKQAAQKTALNSIAPTSTKLSKTKQSKSKSEFSKFYSLPEKAIEQKELTNEIPARRKRSVEPQTLDNNFNNKLSPLNPPNTAQANGQRQNGPMRSNFEQKLPVPIAAAQQLSTVPNNADITNLLGSQQETKETKNPDNKINYKEQVCTSKTEKEIEMEQRKLGELKREVDKLNELVGLLKDQQKLIKLEGQKDIDLNNNEVVDDLPMDAIENSFLYKALKQLEKRRKEDPRKNDPDKSDKTNRDVPDDEIIDIKRNLNTTVKDLNETKEMLIKEKEREEMIEGELKRQNSELKFMRVMMEDLYDKRNSFSGLHKLARHATDDGLRNSDLKDIDSILGAAHTPKSWPMTKYSPLEPSDHNLSVDKKIPGGKTIPNNDLSNLPGFLKTLVPKRQNIDVQPQNEWLENARIAEQATETPFADWLDKYFKQVHKEYISKKNPFEILNKDFEKEVFANQTKSALIELTRHDKDRFKKFGLEGRESNPTENHQNSMHKLLTILNKQKNDNLEEKDHIINQSEISRNETSSSESARASGNSRTDDLDLKLKLIDMLTNEPRSDDSDEKEKRLTEAMKKLIRPQKKTDDELTVEALMALLKDHQEKQKKPQDNLSKLFKSLNEKPQSKSDDVDVEKELRQLQKAINNLRPKEESGFNNFDLFDNRRGKDESQDFQSMLNQIISQNGGNPPGPGLAGQATLNVGGTGSNLDTSSFAVTPQLLNQIMSPGTRLIRPNGYGTELSQQSAVQDLIKNYGASQYGAYQPSYIAGAAGQSYLPNLYPNSNLYGSSPNNPFYGGQSYAPNSYGPNLNSYNSALGGYKPNLIPYGSNAYSSGPSSNYYPGSSNSYGSGYNSGNLGYSNGYQQKFGYGSPQGYGGSTYYPGPYSGNAYQPPTHYPTSTNSAPYQSSNSYGPSIGGYQSSKTNYQAPNYQNSYSASKPTSAGYQGKVEYSVATPTYPSGGVSGYDSYKSNYGGKPLQESSTNYEKSLFQYPSNVGGDYQGYNYGATSYAGPSLDQSYSPSQNPDQYKYGMISDLTQQIQNLENIITGLNKGGDYSQSADDKAAIVGLEQRIYELKGVINSLNQPVYPQHSNSPTYGQSAPSYKNSATYSPPQSTYGSNVPSYNNKPQSPSIPAQYQPNSANRQTYSPQPHSAAQQTGYSVNTPSSQPPASPPYQGTEPHYNANPGSTTNPQEVPYQSYPGDSSAASYQPKESSGEDARIVHVGRKGFNRDEKKSDARRRKRQIEEEPIPPLARRPEEADMSIRLSKANQNTPYGFGDDALIQMANTFKKYLEENLTQPSPNYETAPPNGQNRNSALDGLQQKLDALKIQLGSQKPSVRSFHDGIGSPLSSYSLAPLPSPYGSQSNNLYGSNNIYPIQKSIVSKKNDIFTQILIKISEKVFNSLPDVLSSLFGNLVTSVGDSYGDYYSPLQNILKNLGPVGYLPLILVKVIETLGSVLKHLKKNPLFKQFLLPAIVLGLVGGAILFLLYFLQQDEPYGYISYQGNNGYHNSYPQYEPDRYGNEHHQYKSITTPNYGNYRERSPIENYRSTFDMSNGDNFYGRPIGYNRYTNNNDGNSPLQYSRGYYDYFRGNLENNLRKR